MVHPPVSFKLGKHFAWGTPGRHLGTADLVERGPRTWLRYLQTEGTTMHSNAMHAVDNAEARSMGRLLDQRFGDGSIYFSGGEQRSIFDRARARGLITDDGRITISGRRFVERWID